MSDKPMTFEEWWLREEPDSRPIIHPGYYKIAEQAWTAATEQARAAERDFLKLQLQADPIVAERDSALFQLKESTAERDALRHALREIRHALREIRDVLRERNFTHSADRIDALLASSQPVASKYKK